MPSEEDKLPVIQSQPFRKIENKSCKTTKGTSLVPSHKLNDFQPVNRNISLSGQRVKKSVPQMVDECDLRKKPKKPVGNLPEIVKEGASELVHHPADVVLAAITIQRFFRKIKESKESHRRKLKKRKKKKIVTDDENSETESDSSDYDTSDDEPNDSQDSSSSSESESQVKRAMSPDSSDTESDADNVPNIEDSDVEKAALKIQSAFKGFKVRQEIQKLPTPAVPEDLPDLSCHDVLNSTIKIQSVYRGFMARKKTDELKQSKHNFAQVVNASITIQKAYRKYKRRNQLSNMKVRNKVPTRKK